MAVVDVVACQHVEVAVEDNQGSRVALLEPSLVELLLLLNIKNEIFHHTEVADTDLET